MAVRTIKQSIEIAAPRERVWDVLLQDETYRQWTAEFAEGSYAETDWRPGSKVVFRDSGGSGMIGRVVASERPELVDVEYDGLLMAGVADYDSSEAREIKGGRETYRLSEQGGGTHLAVESDMAEVYYADVSETWVRALNKVKAVAEASWFLGYRGPRAATSLRPMPDQHRRRRVKMGNGELVDETVDQRQGLVGVLSTLSESDWDTPSLCAGWRIREIVAHITMPYRYSTRDVLLAILKERGRFDAAADRLARRETSAAVSRAP